MLARVRVRRPLWSFPLTACSDSPGSMTPPSKCTTDLCHLKHHCVGYRKLTAKQAFRTLCTEKSNWTCRIALWAGVGPYLGGHANDKFAPASRLTASNPSSLRAVPRPPSSQGCVRGPRVRTHHRYFPCTGHERGARPLGSEGTPVPLKRPPASLFAWLWP